ncbi:hypothetical protein HH212_00130 [Massilia forsythiae]|uniref:Uncharacterized protein n=1 Tax=Massilia forsythiae TaxID=2728020 RepID=A0A7Z2ZR23_9BURK|nr:hypothetical protein [Massilia forsythiae]QJD98644.1 hypothetical protein HH212_00130 [Massilia forsythiae]
MTAPYKNWPLAYLRECAEDEMKLASQHKDYRYGAFAIPADMEQNTPLAHATRRGNMISPGRARQMPATTPIPPLWRRNWWVAGALISELGLTIVVDLEDRTVSVGAGGRRRNVTEAYVDHPDRDAATMAAIVRAAIQALEAGRDS